MNKWILGCLGIIALAGCGGGGGDTQPPVISDVQINPRTINYNGTVSIQARITDNKAVESAYLVLVCESEPELVQELGLRREGDLYTRTVTINPNGTTATQYYTMKITAQDPAGNKVETEPVRITVNGFEAPPDPPTTAKH
jgi:hypothetical protein